MTPKVIETERQYGTVYDDIFLFFNLLTISDIRCTRSNGGWLTKWVFWIWKYASSIEIVFLFGLLNANRNSWTHFNLNYNLDCLQSWVYRNLKWSFAVQNVYSVHNKKFKWMKFDVNFFFYSLFVFWCWKTDTKNKIHRTNLYLIKNEVFDIGWTLNTEPCVSSLHLWISLCQWFPN